MGNRSNQPRRNAVRREGPFQVESNRLEYYLSQSFPPPNDEAIENPSVHLPFRVVSTFNPAFAAEDPLMTSEFIHVPETGGKFSVNFAGLNGVLSHLSESLLINLPEASDSLLIDLATFVIEHDVAWRVFSEEPFYLPEACEEHRKSLFAPRVEKKLGEEEPRIEVEFVAFFEEEGGKRELEMMSLNKYRVGVFDTPNGIRVRKMEEESLWNAGGFVEDDE